MTNIESVANFEREINKLDDAVNKPATEDSLFWLNQAIAKFVKLRFNGDFTHLNESTFLQTGPEISKILTLEFKKESREVQN